MKYSAILPTRRIYTIFKKIKPYLHKIQKLLGISNLSAEDSFVINYRIIDFERGNNVRRKNIPSSIIGFGQEDLQRFMKGACH